MGSFEWYDWTEKFSLAKKMWKTEQQIALQATIIDLEYDNEVKMILEGYVKCALI